jgi:hypothetical protein
MDMRLKVFLKRFEIYELGTKNARLIYTIKGAQPLDSREIMAVIKHL